MPPPISSAVAPPLDPRLLEALEGAVRRRVRVGRIAADGGRAASVQIERVEIGESRIDRVGVQDFSARLRCGSALLREVRAILEIHFEVRWSYDLKGFGRDEGVKALGSKAKTIPLHDLRIPMLRDIAFAAPDAEARAVSARVEPVADVALGHTEFADLAVEDTRLPTDGFRIAGLGFRSVTVDRFAAPAAASGRLTIGRVDPERPLRLPDIAATDIELPEVEVPDVGSPEPVTVMDIGTEPFEAPVFKIGSLFKAIFVATPVLHLQIGELVLSELSASASIGAVQVEGATTSVSIRGVAINDVALEGLSAEAIAI